jgi:hypothetical protein
MRRPIFSLKRLGLLTLALFGVAGVLVAGAASDDHGKHRGWEPVPTTVADWSSVAAALGRPGMLSKDNTVYRVSFPRRDLTVTSYGVTIKPGFALGSYVAFARYRDGQTLLMGDLVVTETELQAVTDALHAHGLAQTAVHKHLLAQDPDIWWTHIHGVSTDAVALANGVRAALDRTATPAAAPPAPPPALDLDTAGIDNALGTTGTNDGGIYKFSFARDETISMDRRVLNPAMGVTTALNFQPTGGGRAAINGDFVMTADEVQNVIEALRAGGIQIVELHNHMLDEEPRLFFMHFWANDDAVALARTLRQAVDATAVHPG